MIDVIAAVGRRSQRSILSYSVAEGYTAVNATISKTEGLYQTNKIDIRRKTIREVSALRVTTRCCKKRCATKRPRSAPSGGRCVQTWCLRIVTDPAAELSGGEGRHSRDRSCDASFVKAIARVNNGTRAAVSRSVSASTRSAVFAMCIAHGNSLLRVRFVERSRPRPSCVIKALL